MVQTSDRRFRLLWACVVAVWLAFGVARINADSVPVGSEFVKWCQNEASSAEYILWMCFLYV